MKTLIKTDILRFGFAFLLLGFCAGGAIWPAPTLAATGTSGSACTFDPNNISNFHKTADSDPSLNAWPGPVLQLSDDTPIGKAIYVCPDPALPDPFELEIEFGVKAGSAQTETIGTVEDTGVRAGFTAGNLAYHACLIMQGTNPVVALKTANGFTPGIHASWDGSMVVCRVRRSGTTAILTCGGQSEQTNNLGPDVNAGVQFGTYSKAATVTAKFARIVQTIPAPGPVMKPLEIVADKLEIKTFGVSEVEHEVEGRDEDDADRKSGIKFEGVIHATDGSPLDPTVMPVTVAISGPNGEIYNSGAIASGFVFNGNEYKYKTSSLKIEMEQQNATSYAYKLELKRRNTDLPAGDYSNLTVTITVGDYQGSVSVPLSLNGHKWKY